MRELPSIPEAEFSPPWHQYSIALREQTAARLAAIEPLLGIADEEGNGGVLGDGLEGIVLQQHPVVEGLGFTGNLTTTPLLVMSDTLKCDEETSRVIIRGGLFYVVTTTVQNAKGWSARLYVDGVATGDIRYSSVMYRGNFLGFSFEHSPADLLVHSYEIYATSLGASQIQDRERWMQLEEWRN